MKGIIRPDAPGRLRVTKPVERLLVVFDEPDRLEHDPLARFDAEFVLLTGTLRRMLEDLKTILGGYS